MASIEPDFALVKRAQQGDKSAFSALVAKYQIKIVKLIVQHIRDPSEAVDVAQESFMRAYRALPNFRGESAFYTWFYRIAVNTAKNSSNSHFGRITRFPGMAGGVRSFAA
ncbi:hypothetical protein MishRS11D_44430 (plasmid) [Methylomagnum ishizawai]|nr:hypothetical protein MishRS11D_44430 [Methylomagnum ishizawai]